MRSIIIVCVLVLVAMSAADKVLYPRGCIYINGKCHKECPVGTHAYTTGCRQKMPEATCREPNPQLEPGNLCDYSACYCDAPTVRDEATGQCVQLADCPPLPSDPIPETEQSTATATAYASATA